MWIFLFGDIDYIVRAKILIFKWKMLDLEMWVIRRFCGASMLYTERIVLLRLLIVLFICNLYEERERERVSTCASKNYCRRCIFCLHLLFWVPCVWIPKLFRITSGRRSQQSGIATWTLLIASMIILRCLNRYCNSVFSMKANDRCVSESPVSLSSMKDEWCVEECCGTSAGFKVCRKADISSYSTSGMAAVE